MKWRFDFVVDTVFGTFFLLSLIVGYYAGADVVVPAAFVLYVLVRLAAFRESPEMALLLLFAVSYPAMWLAALAMDVSIHYLAWNVEPRHVVLAFSAQGLFLACMLLAMKGQIPRTIGQYPRRDDGVVFWLCIVAIQGMMTVAVYVSVGSNIFAQSYDFAESSSSVLFEYVLIPIILAYAYSGESRRRKLILIASCVIAVIAPLLVGRRLPASMVVLALIFLYWRPKGLLKFGALVVSGFAALSAVALFRVGQTGASLQQIIFNLDESGVMRNHQGGVVYVAAVYMKLVEEQVFDWAFALDSMLNVALSVFVPSSMVGDSAYINLVAMKHIPIPGNGGMPGVHFYVWGNVVGVVVAGLLLGWLMQRSQTHLLSAVYVTLIFFTFPRWVGYNVNIMFKMGILLILAWVVVRFVHRRLSDRRHAPSFDGNGSLSKANSARTAASVSQREPSADR